MARDLEGDVMIERPYHKGDPMHEQMLRQTLRALDDGWYDLTLKPKKQKCEASRGYLHGLVVPIYGAYLGECNRGQMFDDEEAWDELKKQFRPREFIHPATGEVTIAGKSTKGMRRFQIFELTVQVVEWLESQGVYVPPPDKDWKRARERAEAAERAGAAA